MNTYCLLFFDYKHSDNISTHSKIYICEWKYSMELMSIEINLLFDKINL